MKRISRDKNIHIKEEFISNNKNQLFNECEKGSKDYEEIHINFIKYMMRNLISIIIFLTMWVQVPQSGNDWSKCAVDIPDSSCHWYIKSPDNTFGEGFDWEKAPWFDVNGLNDVARIEKETVVEKLQRQ